MNFITSLGPSCCQLATLRSAVQFAPSSSVSAWLTTRLAACPNLVGHFRVAQLAGVSSVIRLIGKSPNPRRIQESLKNRRANPGRTNRVHYAKRKKSYANLESPKGDVQRNQRMCPLTGRKKKRVSD